MRSDVGYGPIEARCIIGGVVGENISIKELIWTLTVPFCLLQEVRVLSLWQSVKIFRVDLHSYPNSLSEVLLFFRLFFYLQLGKLAQMKNLYLLHL